MLVLNPQIVRFGSAAWEGVVAVVVDRAAQRLIEEWDDAGPYATLVDVPEQRVRVRVVQEVARDEVHVPRPGDLGTLVFYTAPAGSEAGRRKVSVLAVVIGVEHEVSRRRGALRTVTLAGVSATGAADPITVSDGDDG